MSDFDYIFAENGLVAFKNGVEIAKEVKNALFLLYTKRVNFL